MSEGQERQPMGLSEALHIFAANDPRVPAGRRREAGKALWKFVFGRASRTERSPERAEDLTQGLMAGLLARGALPPEVAPTDAAAAGYLRQKLQWLVKDELRRRSFRDEKGEYHSREVPLDENGPPTGVPESDGDDGKAHAAILWAREVLSTEVIPKVVEARPERYQSALAQTLAQLVRIRDRQVSSAEAIAELAREDGCLEDLGPGWIRARDRFHQRAHRALKACFEWLAEQEQAGVFDEWEVLGLRENLRDLALRSRGDDAENLD